MKKHLIILLTCAWLAIPLACSSLTDSTLPSIRKPTALSVSTDEAINCTELNPDPMGESIAEKYEIPYQQVMAWYCADESFEDILLALQTSKLTDLTPDELLERKEETGWDQLWIELGLVPQQN